MRFFYLSLILIIVILLLLSIDRNLVWKTEISLWSDVIKKNGSHSMKVRPYFNLGLAFLNSERWFEGYQNFKKVLELAPDYHKAKYYISEALFRLGRYDEALTYLKEVEYLYENILPYFPEKWEGVGKAFSRPDLYNNIGSCYYNLGDLDLAERYYRKALEYMPSHILANEGLISVLLDKGKKDEAIQRLEYLINIVTGSEDKERLMEQLRMLR